MGIEPAPAPGDAGQGPAAQRGREIRSRTDDAVAQLDQGQSVSVGDQRGKHAGGCIPQLIVDMGGPFAGGSVGGRGLSPKGQPRPPPYPPSTLSPSLLLLRPPTSPTH